MLTHFMVLDSVFYVKQVKLRTEMLLNLKETER